MVGGAIPHVRLPAITRVTDSQPSHEQVPDRLGDDTGRRHGVTEGVAIHEGLVLEAELGKREAVDKDGQTVGRSDPACSAILEVACWFSSEALAGWLEDDGRG
jgi:hypothetical protein